MTSETPERRLSEFVATLDYADLPDEVPDTVTRAFVDTVGVTLAGSVEGAGETTARSAGVAPESADAATLLGVDSHQSPAETALRVGAASHALDYDDLSWAMDGHPSVTLVPALLALADEADASGRDLVTAYAAGFEAECAVAGPISPDHYEAGWHATSTFGTFGAAAAAANLLGLDAETTERALNAAASMPAGTKRNFGSMTKPLHAGLCSRSGVTAASLARAGLTTSRTAISGERGFWDLYGPEADSGATAATFELADEWALETAGIHVKAYPCCYFTHTSIAATQALVDGDVAPEDVERIEVRAAGGAGDALTYPDPSSGLEAKFSMEHAVACAAVRDRVDLSAFEASALDDDAVARLRGRVEFEVDDDLEYDSHEATVRVATADDTYEQRQVNPPGTHDDPLSPDELRAKFDECAERALSSVEVDRVYDVVANLGSVSDVAAALAGER